MQSRWMTGVTQVAPASAGSRGAPATPKSGNSLALGYIIGACLDSDAAGRNQAANLVLWSCDHKTKLLVFVTASDQNPPIRISQPPCRAQQRMQKHRPQTNLRQKRNGLVPPQVPPRRRDLREPQPRQDQVILWRWVTSRWHRIDFFFV
ncbi:hypothetical protein K435DRAFT_794709 [Dendrothele bispora CBS 962.96]|uniref:Uncharacterized protein n=1 Tax=Dendrothele bispora (strain CBS 962.96) TaxID=1314807 RepID=A0A4S8MBI5_DENBC|nr:hypothetical protein K435DRAFT_794709 [Dendrothele bispora CBS 962.96]